MLGRCRRTTATAAPSEKTSVGHGSPYSQATTGIATAATIEASDA